MNHPTVSGVRTAALATSVVAGLLLAGCVHDSEQWELRAAQVQWEENRPGEYTLFLDRSCFCFSCQGVGVVHVQEGVPRDPGSWLLGDDRDPGCDPVYSMTVEDLFREIQKAIDGGYDVVRAEYDDRLGYPTSCGFNSNTSVTDGGYGYQALVRPALGDPGPIEAALARLDEARARWADQGTRTYELHVDRSVRHLFYGYEQEDRFVVTVEEGEVTGARSGYFGELDDWDIRAYEYGVTVETLFGLVERGLRRGSDVTVEYDPVAGWPADLTVREGPGAADGRFRYRVTIP